MSETHLSTPISQTFALIAGDCNTAGSEPRRLGARRPLRGHDARIDDDGDAAAEWPGSAGVPTTIGVLQFSPGSGRRRAALAT